MIAGAIHVISVWAIPVFLVGIPLYGAARRVKVYESFVEGAKEGFQVGIRIIPYLVAILVAVGMLRGAGAIDMLARVLDPILRLYVEEDRSTVEIAELGYEEALVRRVVSMVDRSEYKRRQSPPGIKITPRALGKDRRLPITNHWRG